MACVMQWHPRGSYDALGSVVRAANLLRDLGYVKIVSIDGMQFVRATQAGRDAIAAARANARTSEPS